MTHRMRRTLIWSQTPPSVVPLRGPSLAKLSKHHQDQMMTALGQAKEKIKEELANGYLVWVVVPRPQ